MNDLIVGNSMATRMRLVYQRLAGQGFASPRVPGVVLEVWVLSSTVLPQPGNKVGTWDDAETWVDSNVWYD